MEKHVIIGGSIVRMNMLRDRYLDYVRENAPQFYNESFRNEKVKEQLISQFGEQLIFWKTASHSELLYCADIEVGAAV